MDTDSRLAESSVLVVWRIVSASIASFIAHILPKRTIQQDQSSKGTDLHFGEVSPFWWVKA